MATLKASSSKLTGSGMTLLKASSTGAGAAGRGLAASGLPNRAREDERKTNVSVPRIGAFTPRKIAFHAASTHQHARERMTTVTDIRAAHPLAGAFVPRVVVLDLDGTTIDYRQRLHPRVRDAVRAAAARVPVIVATGRMYRSALPWALELGVHEPLVCYQGALVRGVPAHQGDPGERIFEQALREA